MAERHKEVIPLKQIAKKEGLSFDYLEKIAGRLEKAKLLKAKRGVRGGYFLAKTPSRIKTAEIIEALEGKTGLVKCIAGGREYHCPLFRKCLAKNLWQKIQRSLNSVLNSVSLADLIGR